MLTFNEVRTDAAIAAAFPLMSALRDRIRADTFVAEVRRQQHQGYELVGAFEEATLVALAGIRRSHTLSRGEHVFVDDLVTDERMRGRGQIRTGRIGNGEVHLMRANDVVQTAYEMTFELCPGCPTLPDWESLSP